MSPRCRRPRSPRTPLPGRWRAPATAPAAVKLAARAGCEPDRQNPPRRGMMDAVRFLLTPPPAHDLTYSDVFMVPRRSSVTSPPGRQPGQHRRHRHDPAPGGRRHDRRRRPPDGRDGGPARRGGDHPAGHPHRRRGRRHGPGEGRRTPPTRPRSRSPGKQGRRGPLAASQRAHGLRRGRPGRPPRGHGERGRRGRRGPLRPGARGDVRRRPRRAAGHLGHRGLRRAHQPAPAGRPRGGEPAGWSG